MTRSKFEFVEQDPLVKELSEHHKQQHENIRDQHRGLVRDARKVGHLLLAFDCVINKMFSLEGLEDNKDKIGATLICRDSQDKKITLKLTSVTPTSTDISIRYGTFGNEAKSAMIYNKIKENLN